MVIRFRELFAVFFCLVSLSAMGQELEIDFPPFMEIVLSDEERSALANYDASSPRLPVKLNRVLIPELNSNDYTFYHELVVDTLLIEQYAIKSVTFRRSDRRSDVLGMISFDEFHQEIDRTVKNKYFEYTGDYSEFCLYKESEFPYEPSTSKRFKEASFNDVLLASEFVFDDSPLRGIEIVYEFYHYEIKQSKYRPRPKNKNGSRFVKRYRYKKKYYRKEDGSLFKVERNKGHYFFIRDWCGHGWNNNEFKSGTWKYYSADGKLLKKEKYKHGKLVKSEER